SLQDFSLRFLWSPDLVAGDRRARLAQNKNNPRPSRTMIGGLVCRLALLPEVPMMMPPMAPAPARVNVDGTRPIESVSAEAWLAPAATPAGAYQPRLLDACGLIDL